MTHISSSPGWRGRSLLFSPSATPGFQTHASVPIPQVIDSRDVQVYFSGRDHSNVSVVKSFIIRLERGYFRVIRESKRVLLGPGSLGAFDDAGSMGSCIVQNGEDLWLYYVGWNLGHSVPFRNSIGLASWDSSAGVFRRLFEGPIVDRTKSEPFFCASAFVRSEAPNRWSMWYTSATRWDLVDGEPKHAYHIKYAYSRNGIDWIRKGCVAIDFNDDSEYAITRPWVIRNGDLWQMWYSYRGKANKVGYAESADGLNWTRKDSSSLTLASSERGWDSQMVEYAAVFELGGRSWMLYNGNGYGATGIGIAELSA